MTVDIVKSHGTANDFVIVEDLADSLELTSEVAARLCDRHRGVGADGVLRVAPGREHAVFMDYRNADGSLAEICGNGVRCFAKYCFDRGIITGTTAMIETRAGTRRVTVHRDGAGMVAQVDVDMGVPMLAPADVPVDVEGADALSVDIEVDVEGVVLPVHLSAVGMGNPHAVVFVEDVDTVDVPAVGAAVEHHDRFPKGTNVEFVEVRRRDLLVMRVWERGSGETLSCGSGACAAVVAAVATGRADRRVDVQVPGGLLHVRWDDAVTLTGPAVEVYSGTIDLDTLRRAGEVGA